MSRRKILMKRIISICILPIALSVAVMAMANMTDKATSASMDTTRLQAVMEENINSLLELMNVTAEAGSSDIKTSDKVFTKEAADGLKKMWKTSPMSCSVKSLNARILNTNHGFQVRGIPVDILEADASEARQELTIDFDEMGKISGISIAIEMHRYDELMAQQSSDLDYSRRQIIIEFVENYRTAYNRKDLAYISQVYSDDALIIDGRMVKPTGTGAKFESATLQSNNSVVYFKYNKNEYMKKLKDEFKKNKFINVKFDEIEVLRHPKFNDVYGVTLKQTWRSDTRSDEGYLFLMVDFHNTDNPMIQVRTWQPYKNEFGQVVLKKQDVFNLGSFKIMR